MAQSWQRALAIGRCPTAWAMLHRMRSVLVHPGRDRPAGTVEVDETCIGGEGPGLRGGRQRGKKVRAGIAVEVCGPRGIARCRLSVLADASATTLGSFVAAAGEPGAHGIADGRGGCHTIRRTSHTRTRVRPPTHSRRAAGGPAYVEKVVCPDPEV